MQLQSHNSQRLHQLAGRSKLFTASSMMGIVFVAVFAAFSFGVWNSVQKASRDLQHASALSSYGPGGTYSDWYFPGTSYQSLEWTFLPVKQPDNSLAAEGLLHYYAYNFGLVNSDDAVGNGYAGFQSNGIFNGQSKGKVINFSIWGSNGGNSSTGWVNAQNTESGGYQIMIPYTWVEGHHYRFQLKAGTSVSDANGNWWGLWVTEQETGVTTYVGEERVQLTRSGLPLNAWKPSSSMFGEDLHWWRTINGPGSYQCNQFQNSSMAALDITANGTVRPSSLWAHVNSGDVNTSKSGWVSEACPVTVYSDGKNNVQHNLGYWATTPPNVLTQPVVTPTPTSTPTPVASPTPVSAPSRIPSVTPVPSSTVKPTVTSSVRVTVPSTISRINSRPYDLNARSVALFVSVTGSSAGLVATVNGTQTPIASGKLSLPTLNGDYKVIVKIGTTTYFSQMVRIRHPDFNRDNTVNAADLNLVSVRIGKPYRAAYTIYDLNLDGKIDATDTAKLQAAWGK